MAYIIAEVANNHDGDIYQALALVLKAYEAGANAVKFQLHIAEKESLKDAPPPPYYDGSHWDLFKRTSLPIRHWIYLKELVNVRGLDFLCSPFSIEAVDLLEEIGVNAYKIASGEVTNIPMLKRIRETGKKVYLSSGMSNLQEIDEAIKVLGEVTLMQCSSQYPCPYENVGLNLIPSFKALYGMSVGLSDHTNTIYAPIVAVALGATVIEKHICLEKKGVDASVSLLPDEFKQMVDGIRATEIMLSSKVDKNDLSPYKEMKGVFEKSITSTRDIFEGTVIGDHMISIRKPGGGIPPKEYDSVIDSVARRTIKKDSIIYEKDLR